MGEYSARSLCLTQRLGYATVFWSFAHRDWLVDEQPPVAVTLERLVAGRHDGAIYLLHQTVIVIAAFSIVGLPAAGPLQWLTLLMVSVACTYTLYEVVRRSAVARFFFGMRPKRKVATVGRRAAEGVAAPASAR